MLINYSKELKQMPDFQEYEINFKEFINQLTQDLKIEKLSEINVTNNFEKDVIEYQQEHGLTLGITKEVNKRAFGKTITRQINDDIETVIFVDITADALMPMVISHELSHCHNDYYLNRIYDTDMFSNKNFLNNQSNLLYLQHFIAHNSWGEYISNRLSAKYMPDSVYTKESIDLIINEANQKVLQAKFECVDSNNYRNFFLSILAITNDILKHFAYALGYLHGNEYSEYFEPDDDFKEIWMLLSSELQNLFDIYPDWKGLENYNAIISGITKIWEYYQIDLKQLPNDISVGFY